MSNEIQEPSRRRIVCETIGGHQEVYGVFEQLIKGPGMPMSSKGGTFYQPGRVYKFQDGEEFSVSETHHKMSSFTPEQEGYIDLARATLRDSITSSEDGLVERFKKAWGAGKPISEFEGDLAKAYLGCIEDVFTKYPKLIPAYYGFLVSTGAGAEGLQLAIHEGMYPRRITSGKMADVPDRFVGIRGEGGIGGEIKVVSGEVQCAAPVLAMKIVGEARSCVEHAGFKVNQKDLTSFSGPLSMVRNQVSGILRQKMEQLGYELSADSEA